MRIEKKKPLLHPNTLIVLKVLKNYLVWVKENCDINTVDGTMTAEEVLRDLKDAFLIDLLWKRASFGECASSVFPPIHDVLNICHSARLHSMRCEFIVTSQEEFEYDRTDCMRMIKMIRQTLPGGTSEYTNVKSINMWELVKAEHLIMTTLGESGILADTLVLARQEVINRDFKLNLEENPHEDPSITTTKDFIQFNPVNLQLVSEHDQLRGELQPLYDSYIQNFINDAELLDWQTHVLDWPQQKAITSEILAHKHAVYKHSKGFWVSAKDFKLEDEITSEGYKPLETLLALDELKEIEIDEIKKNENGQLELLILVKKLAPIAKSQSPMPLKEQSYLSIEEKKMRIAQVVLDYRPLRTPEGTIVIDPSEMIASIPSLSKRGLHDLCLLMKNEGYLQEVTFHYPRAKLEPMAWNYIGPAALDGYDRMNRITFFPNEEKLSALASRLDVTAMLEEASLQKEAVPIATEQENIRSIAYLLSRDELSGELFINGIAFGKPQSGSIGDRLCEILLKKVDTNPIILETSQLRQIQNNEKRKIPDVITSLGFQGDLRKMFFPATSNYRVVFANPIYEDDLSKRNLPRLPQFENKISLRMKTNRKKSK